MSRAGLAQAGQFNRRSTPGPLEFNIRYDLLQFLDGAQQGSTAAKIIRWRKRVSMQIELRELSNSSFDQRMSVSKHVVHAHPACMIDTKGSHFASH